MSLTSDQCQSTGRTTRRSFLILVNERLDGIAMKKQRQRREKLESRRMKIDEIKNTLEKLKNPFHGA